MAESKQPETEQIEADTADQIIELENGQNPAAADIDTAALPSVKAPAKAPKAGPKARAAKAETNEEPAAAAPKPAATKKSQPQIKRDPLARRGKKYREAIAKVDRTKLYSLTEALELARQTSTVKFDASVEIHANLGVDPRQADQMVRSSVVLPAGTGKSLRVAVLTADKAAEAKQAGADVVGESDLINDIEKGKLDFDVLITSPAMMPQLAKLAKVLGPKGLMPNPKSGTVTNNVVNAVKEAKAGKVEFRIDRQAIVHQVVGRVSFKPEDLLANAKTFLDALQKAKPAAAKGTYVKALTVTTSMGPGIKLDVQAAMTESHTR